ncbi:Sec7 domain-containing protein, partial [Toxoplasma gondii RUB]
AIRYLELVVLCLIEGTEAARFSGASLLASLLNEETRDTVVLSSLLHLHTLLREGSREERRLSRRSFREETKEKKKQRQGVIEPAPAKDGGRLQTDACDQESKGEEAGKVSEEMREKDSKRGLAALSNNTATFFLCLPVLNALAHLACSPLPSTFSSSSSSSSSSERRDLGREGKSMNAALDALFRLLLTYGASFNPVSAFCTNGSGVGSFSASSGDNETHWRALDRGGREEEARGNAAGEQKSSRERQQETRLLIRSQSDTDSQEIIKKAGERQDNFEEEKTNVGVAEGVVSHPPNELFAEERRMLTAEGRDVRWKMIFQGLLCPLFDDLFLLLRLNLLPDQRALPQQSLVLPASQRASASEREESGERRKSHRRRSPAEFVLERREVPSPDEISRRVRPVCVDSQQQDEAASDLSVASPDKVGSEQSGAVARASFSSASSSLSTFSLKRSERQLLARERDAEGRASETGSGVPAENERKREKANAEEGDWGRGKERGGTLHWAEMSCCSALRQLVVLVDRHLGDLQTHLKNFLSLIFAAIDEDSAVERLARLGVDAFRNFLVALGRRTTRRGRRETEGQRPSERRPVESAPGDCGVTESRGELRSEKPNEKQRENVSNKSTQEGEKKDDLADDDVDLDACWRAVAEAALALFQRTTPTSLLGSSFCFSSKDVLLQCGVLFLPVRVSRPQGRPVATGETVREHSGEEMECEVEEEDAAVCVPVENSSNHCTEPEGRVQKSLTCSHFCSPSPFSSSASSSFVSETVEFPDDGFSPNRAGDALPRQQREAILHVLVSHMSGDVSALFSSESSFGDQASDPERAAEETREREVVVRGDDTERRSLPSPSVSRAGGSPGLTFEPNHVVTHCIVQLLLVDVLQQVVAPVAPYLPASVLSLFLCALESAFLFATLFNQQVAFRQLLQQRGFMSGMRQLPALHKQSREAVSASLSLLTSVLSFHCSASCSCPSSSSRSSSSSALRCAREVQDDTVGRRRSTSAAEAADRFLRVARWLVCQFLSKETEVAKLTQEKRFKEALARQQSSGLSARDETPGWTEKSKSDALKHLELTEGERELAGFAPLICGQLLFGLSRFPDETKALYSDAIFSLLVELIAAESSEVRRAVRDFFAVNFAAMAKFSFCSPMKQRQTLLASLPSSAPEACQQAASGRRSSKANQNAPAHAVLISTVSPQNSPSPSSSG